MIGGDVSERSLAHLDAEAQQEALPIETVLGSYLTADLGSNQDAAILIHEDYSALSPTQRALLLTRARDALRPGGQIVFDVTSAARFPQYSDARREGIDLSNGFWAPSPYRGGHETWTYPELPLVLDRYIIETSESTKMFWNWMHCLSQPEVALELATAGLELAIQGDAAGADHDQQAPSFAVQARRPEV